MRSVLSRCFGERRHEKPCSGEQSRHGHYNEGSDTCCKMSEVQVGLSALRLCSIRPYRTAVPPYREQKEALSQPSRELTVASVKNNGFDCCADSVPRFLASSPTNAKCDSHEGSAHVSWGISTRVLLLPSSLCSTLVLPPSVCPNYLEIRNFGRRAWE